MRSGLQLALGIHPSLTSAHAGLLYERHAELICERPAGADEDDRGKLRPQDLEALIDRVAAIGIPRVYRRALARWRTAIGQSKALIQEVEASTRLLIGHGNPAPGEVGITLHPVYGTPMIPGSALKGLANHYLADWGAAADETAWHGVRYDRRSGRPVGPPGTAHGILFGAPSLPRDDGGEQLGIRGHVVFEDAWLIPIGDEPPLIVDVLTPHQKGYYRDLGAVAPDDWSDPNPVSFLSVRPRTRFLIAVTALGGGTKATELALDHLLDALAQWGVGAKTAASYGRLLRCDHSLTGADEPVPSPGSRPQPIQPTSSAGLRALADAVAAVLSPKDEHALPLAQRFDRQDWDALLRGLGADEGIQAQALLAQLNEHRGLHKRRAERIDVLIARVKP